MAHKPQRDKMKNNSMKNHNNQDLSKKDNKADHKRKSKLRKRQSSSQQHFNELDFCEQISPENSPTKVNTMGSYYTPNTLIPNYIMPYTWSQWDVIAPQIHNPLYTIPVPTVPVALISPVSPPLSVIPTSVLSYTDIIYTTYPPVVPYVANSICTALDHMYDPISSFAALTPVTKTDENQNETVQVEPGIQKVESLEYYLTLPKDLFPRPKMLTLDPNPIIDELCRIKGIEKHSPWILDLEFGVPRNALSRPVAVYDVQSNNIHCKSTPGAVHPIFATCSEDFRKVFLFYYDGVVSVWYRGYIHLTNDDSVINFQNWLVVPMQALGMCWS